MISEQAAEIFLKARTLDPATRIRYVTGACADDPTLLREVSLLLSGANESEAYFDGLARKVSLEVLAEDDTPLPANKVIGSWRLLRRIGRGGMGAVYLVARSDEHFEQQAALKILPTGLDTDVARARFLVERQILARLVHDNIARLLDGGVTEDDVPYFVMDYVEGLPIDEYCVSRRLGIDAKLNLLLDVADAVQYAHRKLIIHRDLKPSNVLVTETGRVRLLDFGIAKMLEPDGNELQPTRMAQRPVTPNFASPEMLCGEQVDVTTDIYSIGVLMYLLLTERTPLCFNGMSLTEMWKHSANEVPPPVSHINHALRGDLDAIVAKALAKQPQERYSSVESLANDIRNYLNGHPVSAKTPSTWYRARKFVNRHRAGTAFSVFTVIAVATIAALAVRSATVSARQTREITAERDRAEQTKEFLVSIFESADPDLVPGNQTARDILESGRARIERELTDQPELQADLLETMSHVYISWRQFEDGQAVLEREQDLRRATSGEVSAEYIDVLFRLAVNADIAGDYDLSLRYVGEALEASEQLGSSYWLALSHERLGRILHLQGDYTAADTHYRRALAWMIEASGKDSMEAVFIREQLANLLNHQERYEESLVEFETSLAVRRKVISGDSSEISPILLGMGSVLTKLGRQDDALRAYEEGYAMNERLYGADNSYNMYFANGLGKLAEVNGDLETAIQRYSEARRLVALHTPYSPNMAFAEAGLARVYALQGRYDLAIPMFRSALQIFTERLPSHWLRGDTKWRLGLCLVETANYVEAEALILDGLLVVEEQWGHDHQNTADARSAAVRLYEKWGKAEMAQNYR
ncbi:MAG TPA: serine/threonine-protein kinase [Woeseiaceae bacterium]|nr:serine/threonine-protein kinase [Woeseiaceae bacterium]